MTSDRNGASIFQAGPGRPPLPVLVRAIPGLSIWKGTVSEEYLPDLKPWSKAVKVFKEMSDDAVIGTLYESIKAPLLKAKFTIQPASQEQADLEAADWLEASTIESESFSWPEHVEEALDFMSFGFSLFEKVLAKQEDGLLWLEDLLPIGQETLYEWGALDSTGRPESFRQNTTGQDGRLHDVTVPMDKLVHFVFRGRKRNPMGNSLSRNLYRPWYFKKNLEVIEAIGAERDVGNVPVAILGEGFYSSDDIEKLEKALGGLRIDETSYIIAAHGTEVRPFGAGGKVYNVREIIRDYQHIIRQRFFMDFVAFGSEQVGTQALAKEVTSFFSLALGSIQHHMMRGWNMQLVPWLFRWNQTAFPNISGLPKIVWAEPGKINVQSLAQAASTLLQAGAIHYSKPTEDYLREQFEFPPITEEEISEQEQLALEQQQATAEIEAASRPPPGEIRGGDEARKMT